MRQRDRNPHSPQHFLYDCASMAEWSKALDLSSSNRMIAWVRTPLVALLFLPLAQLLSANENKKVLTEGIRTQHLCIPRPSVPATAAQLRHHHARNAAAEKHTSKKSALTRESNPTPLASEPCAFTSSANHYGNAAGTCAHGVLQSGHRYSIVILMRLGKPLWAEVPRSAVPIVFCRAARDIG